MTVKCPIWNNSYEAEKDYIPNRDIYLYNSVRAGGKFLLNDAAICQGCDNTNCPLELDGNTKAKLTTYISERQDNIKDLLIDRDLIEEIKRKKRITVIERSNALLKYLASTIENLGADTPKIRNPVSTYGIEVQIATESSNLDEVVYLYSFLEERSLCYAPDRSMSDRVPYGKITASGYTLLEELEIINVNSNKVFVAMWFDTETEDAWNAIKAAVMSCGFDPIRIDKEDFNGDISDEIIGHINQSKFIIADFTAGFYAEDDRDNSHIPRGGVYFEAGYAKGLGIEIIYTCRHDCLDHIHFDTQQNNHIRWIDEKDLNTKLVNRINATIHKPQ